MEIYGNDPNPDTEVFTESMWKELETLTAFDCFENLLEDITKNLDAWRSIMKANGDEVFELVPEPY